MERVVIGPFRSKFKSAFRNLKSAILLCALRFAILHLRSSRKKYGE
jgi:hypothetical protein